MYYVICWKNNDEEIREVINDSFDSIAEFERNIRLDSNNTAIEHYSLREAFDFGIGFPRDDEYDPKTDSFIDEIEESNTGIPQTIALKETTHDYQRALVGNYYSNEPDGAYDSWQEFKDIWAGFHSPTNVEKFDDTYHFLFRYDINDREELGFQLELCFMLQRKGIYTHIYVNNIQEDDMPEITKWLKGRKAYMLQLWKEVI